eukprot:1155000-Pelagomonas_calceolata.AAC.9
MQHTYKAHKYQAHRHKAPAMGVGVHHRRCFVVHGVTRVQPGNILPFPCIIIHPMHTAAQAHQAHIRRADAMMGVGMRVQGGRGVQPDDRSYILGVAHEQAAFPTSLGPSCYQHDAVPAG